MAGAPPQGWRPEQGTVSTVTPASLLGLAAGSFVSTNVDNFVVTTAQFAAAPAHRVRRIVAGQLAGFLLLVAVSVAGAVVLFELPVRWVGLLGLVPIVLGIRGLLALRRPPDQRDPKWPVAAGFFTAGLVTIGNGGDNLAVYIPVLRQSDLAQGAFIVACLIVFDVAMCAGAYVLGRHPRTLGTLERAGAYAIPVLYCAIGVVVIVRAGTIGGLV
jgi:cadmium resistance protein CadD (predicted permease)